MCGFQIALHRLLSISLFVNVRSILSLEFDFDLDELRPYLNEDAIGIIVGDSGSVVGIGDEWG